MIFEKLRKIGGRKMKEEQQRKNVKRALKKRIAENQSKGVQYYMFRGS